MAFDAFFLSAVLTEIREKTPCGRVEKIHQPSRDTHTANSLVVQQK